MNNVSTEMKNTYDALAIILTAPVWPYRDKLSETGKALHDAIVAQAKPYARAVSELRYGDALKILGDWGRLVSDFMDATRIKDNEPAIKLLEVYKHYADQIADFGVIEDVVASAQRQPPQ